MKYHFKYRSQKWDKLPDGWYIYSRLYSRRKDGGVRIRRYRMAGPFKTKIDAQAQAGIMAIKFNEFAQKMQKKEEDCGKK